jgi:hypothetical protein
MMKIFWANANPLHGPFCVGGIIEGAGKKPFRIGCSKMSAKAQSSNRAKPIRLKPGRQRVTHPNIVNRGRGKKTTERKKM